MSLGKKAVYSPEYEVDMGNHVFPTVKYRMVKEKLVNCRYYSEKDFICPAPATVKQVSRVHHLDYVQKIKEGTLSYTDEIKLEIPYSRDLARSSFICARGTVESCRQALKQGFCIHIGGGFHHSFPDHGEGFCVFNDVALGAVFIREKGKKVFIADCDLHQGNGTAAVFKNDPRVFTFSIHQENIYPVYKEKSDMDIGLEDQVCGKKYNALLKDGLEKVKSNFKPDFMIYVAGADPYRGDQLGKLNLSIEDLKERDCIIKKFALSCGIPCAVVFAGGYSCLLEDTVNIHFNTSIIFSKP